MATDLSCESDSNDENRCAGHLGNLARLSDPRHRGVSKVLMNRIELDH